MSLRLVYVNANRQADVSVYVLSVWFCNWMLPWMCQTPDLLAVAVSHIWKPAKLEGKKKRNTMLSALRTSRSSCRNMTSEIRHRDTCVSLLSYITNIVKDENWHNWVLPLVKGVSLTYHKPTEGFTLQSCFRNLFTYCAASKAQMACRCLFDSTEE